MHEYWHNRNFQIIESGVKCRTQRKHLFCCLDLQRHFSGGRRIIITCKNCIYNLIIIYSVLLEIRCPYMTQTNGQPNTTDNLFGTRLLVTCYHGYLINGQQSLVANCTERGHWSTEATCSGDSNQSI